MALTSLTDQSLGIPHLEGLLQDQLSLGVNVPIEPWRGEEEEEERGLSSHLIQIRICKATLQFKSLWSLRNVLVFERKTLFFVHLK